MGNIFGTIGNVAGNVISATGIPGADKIGSAISGASSAIGGASAAYENRKASENANATNMSINQQNLAFNKEQNELNRQFNASEAEKARLYNAEQAQMQFDRSAKFEKEMWQAQNEYNSPSAQVQRLIDAGFNPNLFSGDNTAGSVGSASSSAASASPASSSALGAPSSLGVNPVSIVNPAMEAAQVRLLNAQADKLVGDTNLAQAQANRVNQLLDLEKDSIFIKNELDRYQLEKLNPAQLDNLEAATKECVNRGDEINQTIKNLQKQWEQLDDAHKRAIIENETLPKLFAAQILEHQASANASNASAALSRKEAEYVGEQMANCITEGKMLRLDFDIKRGGHLYAYESYKNEMKFEMLYNRFKVDHPILFYSGEKISNALGGIVSGAGRAAAALAK